MLRINEESFNQGVRQVAFYHGVPADDERYDSNMDVINDQLMPLGGEDAKDTDQVMENPIAETPQPDDITQPEESVQPDETIDII